MSISTTIEGAYLTSAHALGIEPTWDKTILATMKRRDAAQALADLQPRDAAQELMAAPNPRQWDSILSEITQHNAKVETAKAAIRGRLFSATQAQLDAQLKQFLPQYADQAYERVSGVLASITDTAAHVPTMSAETAVREGFGDKLSDFHQHAHAIRQHTALGSAVAPTGRVHVATHALALIVAPEPINPIKRTQPTRWSAPGGELKSGPEDVARKDATHNLLTAWSRDEVDTLRRLARREFDGFELSAATAEDYRWRVEQFANSQRVIHVDD